MKKYYILLFVIMLSTAAIAQKKGKIKGSKTVTVEQKEVEPFENLEVEDNLQVFLVKGGTQGLEIEADDNLHEVIKYEVSGNTLRLYTLKDITGHKMLSVRVTYTGSLKTVSVKHEVTLNALADLELENIAIKNFDYSKSYLNVKSGSFSLALNDKSKAEINVRSENTELELSKNADLKALIASTNVRLDMYQKTTAVLEGDAANFKLRLDNNSTFTGKKFTAKNMELTAEGYTVCSIMATETLSISANGKTEIQLLGTPKIDMKNFADSAVLYKKLQ
ncbi:MAG: DUF2807 domain-containing protein [Sphingobacteriaceae bacterium]|nr:MAG: DUF2807 domain-containing protein [Sphingobacteriaceae bacterium]